MASLVTEFGKASIAAQFSDLVEDVSSDAAAYLVDRTGRTIAGPVPAYVGATWDESVPLLTFGPRAHLSTDRATVCQLVIYTRHGDGFGRFCESGFHELRAGESLSVS